MWFFKKKDTNNKFFVALYHDRALIPDIDNEAANHIKSFYCDRVPQQGEFIAINDEDKVYKVQYVSSVFDFNGLENESRVYTKALKDNIFIILVKEVIKGKANQN